MQPQQLLIPDKIKIGFQNRSDTYTGKLGYVVYFDTKGVLRKQKSWDGWRDQKIDPLEFSNEPIEGFVLNRDVGGARRSYGWDTRIEKVRVYDPRDFEFEIDIPNLLFILKECDASRGKGLEGKFCYAWRGNTLVLLPTSCEDYKNSKTYTELQTKGVKIKELVPGVTYITKKQQIVTYLGKFDYHFKIGNQSAMAKKYVFFTDKTSASNLDGNPVNFNFVVMKDTKSLATVHSDTIVSNLAELVDKYYKSSHGSKIVKLFLKEVEYKKDDRYREYWYFEESPGVFVQCTFSESWHTKKVESIQASSKFYLKDDVLIEESCYGTAYSPDSAVKRHDTYWGREQKAMLEWHTPTNHRLFAELESGAIFRFDYDTFREK